MLVPPPRAKVERRWTACAKGAAVPTEESRPVSLSPLVIRTRKRRNGSDPLVMVTAYDEPSARYVDEAGVDLILVGDSVANVVLGHADTLHVTVEEMCHHVRAVGAAKPRAHIVADMPWLSYHVDRADSVRNAGANQRAGVSHAVGPVHVIAEPRHVRDDVGPRLGRAHRANVVAHLFNGDVQRVGVSEHDVRHRVTDQDEVDAGLVDVASARLVVGGHHHERVAAVSALACTDHQWAEAHWPTFFCWDGCTFRARRPPALHFRTRWWNEHPTHTSTA